MSYICTGNNAEHHATVQVPCNLSSLMCELWVLVVASAEHGIHTVAPAHIHILTAQQKTNNSD